MSAEKLPKNADVARPGEKYVPLVPGSGVAEFTLKAALSGSVLGIAFGFANTYLGLKAGLTISTSIPPGGFAAAAWARRTAPGSRLRAGGRWRLPGDLGK
ncbi:MAG: hypothetical protein P8R42_11440 [Candidatus Binatia bacterium]|nr:hypothetical protein [Candidatus Binatia bacterium]